MRLSFRMRSARILSRLAPTPTSLAGYLAWLTVAIGFWQYPPDRTPLRAPAGAIVAALCLFSFVAGFGLRASAVTQQPKSVHNTLSMSLMVASTLALLALGPSGLTPILLIVIAAVAEGLYPLRVTVMVLVPLNLAFLGILVLGWHVANPALELFTYGLFQSFAVLTTLQRARAERASRQLREVNAQLLATRELLAESARDGERLRVSRELHDVAGHRLTALALNLELLGQEAGVSQRHEWQVARALVTDLLSELRSVVASLRRHHGIDVREALRRIADAFPTPSIHLDVDERVRIDGAERADVILRAGQEGLTNAVRHANAHNIWLSLNQDQTTLRLEVRDDGTSRGAHTVGYGLRGIRERLRLLGGSMEADSSPEGGFRLKVALPAQEQP